MILWTFSWTSSIRSTTRVIPSLRLHPPDVSITPTMDQRCLSGNHMPSPPDDQRCHLPGINLSSRGSRLPTVNYTSPDNQRRCLPGIIPSWQGYTLPCRTGASSRRPSYCPFTYQFNQLCIQKWIIKSQPRIADIDLLCWYCYIHHKTPMPHGRPHAKLLLGNFDYLCKPNQSFIHNMPTERFRNSIHRTHFYLI